jgi:hypothetical protein
VITLPNKEALTKCVISALDNVAKKHAVMPISNRDWFPEIAGEIAKTAGVLGMKCYARGKDRGQPAEGCDGTEWLFDFVALIDDEAVPDEDRFIAQAALVGEIEWGVGVDEDFEKLLIVDSLVCFMTFQEWSNESANKAIDRLRGAVQRRHEYGRLRGVSSPSTFVLSCYIIPDNRFIHLVV